MELNDLDILEINASSTNSVDDVRDKIVNFVQMISFGDFKVVLLDEADYHPNTGGTFGVMEEYLQLVSFYSTCNYSNRIIPLHPKMSKPHCKNRFKSEFHVLQRSHWLQGVTPNLDILDTYVKVNILICKCINMVQMNCPRWKSVSCSHEGDRRE